MQDENYFMPILYQIVTFLRNRNIIDYLNNKNKHFNKNIINYSNLNIKYKPFKKHNIMFKNKYKNSF